ncbi:phospho-N-acetylmuramoyl-pentapeptide-transferase [Candidatus Soleaferrea massiliensis]|uniref:phospho-N-acetylmuramoyl-pentapeptide- transferase n=1 Tax=Candidatus Soleaferrea massiliensis TaxID=1470354 RepID=UPI00058C86CE|nr:phospho-N-acetylmuramoyl-pentapeptide-transferase [Candidatus Soleaferrea massiliensis]
MNSLPVIMAAVIAFAVTAVLGFWLIPFLKKLKYGQTILDIGPVWHKDKQGTPTMGGIMFIIGMVLAILISYLLLASQAGMLSDPAHNLTNVKLVAGLLMALAYGLIGFIDDYIKVVKKRNLGLTATQKLIFQFLTAGAYLLSIYLAGDKSTVVVFPLIGQLDFGFFYYPLMLLLIVFIVNAVNLTDGVDGLATSVTFVSAIGFMIIATLLGFVNASIMSTALAAGCVGFLVWNFHPAKVFMGDTGSLFLGGMLVAVAFALGLPVLLLPVGIIYIVEALSVVLQVISFKTTGKRIFKMSPIHHHFEMGGWSEVKIVGVFSLVQLIGCGIAIACVYFM